MHMVPKTWDWKAQRPRVKPNNTVIKATKKEWQKFLIKFCYTGRLVPCLVKMRRASSCSRRKPMQRLRARYYVQWDLGILTQAWFYLSNPPCLTAQGTSQKMTQNLRPEWIEIPRNHYLRNHHNSRTFGFTKTRTAWTYHAHVCISWASRTRRSRNMLPSLSQK